jgi:hypothetical protein
MRCILSHDETEEGANPSLYRDELVHVLGDVARGV